MYAQSNNLKLGQDSFLHHAFQLLFANHPTIRRYIVCATDNVVK
jgi:hypothetical protein